MDASSQLEQAKNNTQIRESLQKAKIKPETLQYLASGEASNVFAAKIGMEDAVVRMRRQDTPNNKSFANEHHQLLFLEYMGIDFAPRSLFYDAELDMHVISYVDGKDASVLDLDSRQLQLYVSQLRQLKTLQYSDYEQFCNTHSMKAERPRTQQERYKINVSDRLKSVQTLAQKHDLPIETEIQALQQKSVLLAKTLDDLPLIRVYVHGDLRYNNGTGNIRITDSAVHFIDWESSRFLMDSVAEIGDIIASLPEPVSHSSRIRELIGIYVSDMSDPEELHAAKIKIKNSMMFAQVGNPLWSLERYALMVDQQMPNAEAYLHKSRTWAEHMEYFTNFDV